MDKDSSVDIVIFGGGIAGLWLLAKLRRLNYSAVLLESGSLGGVQTIASQGIIHGGTKYALGGKLSDASVEIGGMPQIWRDCLNGEGELDLREVKVLSSHQNLWCTRNLSSRLAGFFAGKAMRSRMEAIDRNRLPQLFDHPSFGGDLYRLDEPVLDIPSLVDVLVKQQGRFCFSTDNTTLALDQDKPGRIIINSAAGTIRLQARRLIFTAGEGTTELLSKLGIDRPTAQLRPLHMVMVTGALPELYAHCLEGSANPRITITSHTLADGRQAWYLGGQLAERGVERDRQEQIKAAKSELRATLPWIDLDGTRWSTFRINRAEPKSRSGERPKSCSVHTTPAAIAAWPIKLAFAPRLAAKIITTLNGEKLLPGDADIAALQALPQPPIAQPPWELEKQWS